jgi:uncharacterized glyoxalase superfamily protein PhnB
MKIHELYVYLTVSDAAAAIDYYMKAFGAREKFRLTEPGGRIGHAEMDFGGWTVMLADEFPEMGLRSATSIGASPVSIHLHVDSADEVVRRAAEAGGRVEMEPADQFYGERSGVIRDPFGHRWLIGSHTEDVAPDEMQRRYDKLMAG